MNSDQRHPVASRPPAHHPAVRTVHRKNLLFSLRAWRVYLSGFIGGFLIGAVVSSAQPATPPGGSEAASSDQAIDQIDLSNPASFPLLEPRNNLDQFLSDQRWQEQSLGLSFRPPLGARLIRESLSDALLRIVEEDRYQIHLFIRRLREPRSLGELLQSTLLQVAAADRSARLLDQRQARIQNHPAALVYILIPEKQRNSWILGHALVQVDPQTFVHLRLEGLQEHYAKIRPLFEALFQSIQLEDPALLEARRRQLLENAQELLNRLDPASLRPRLIAEQWFRILENRKDIGYMRIQQSTARMLQTDGLRVEIQAHMDLDQEIMDSESSFFLSQDRHQEIWSIRTTLRSRDALLRPNLPRPLPPQNTWVETGVRNGRQIEVQRDTPTGPVRQVWEQPQAYLSQVEVHLLALVLPRDRAVEYGFYAYYPNTGKLSFRTERVEPTGDGTIRVYSRPAPDQEEQISRYDLAGRLLERQLGPTRQLIPASRAELAAIWNWR